MDSGHQNSNLPLHWYFSCNVDIAPHVNFHNQTKHCEEEIMYTNPEIFSFMTKLLFSKYHNHSFDNLSCQDSYSDLDYNSEVWSRPRTII